MLIMALLVTGTPAGAVLAEPGWEAAADRYVVYARASVGNLRVRAG